MKIRFLLAASVIAMSALTDVAAFARQPIGASSTSDGRTTTSVRNPDGSHTVTNGPAAPPAGKFDASVTGPDGVTRPYVPGPRPGVGASSTSAGQTTTSVRNADGTHTVATQPAPVSGFAAWFARPPNVAANVQASPE